jgi:hypothetical protein
MFFGVDHELSTIKGTLVVVHVETTGLETVV